MSMFKVWIEIEEETDDGEYVDHSFDQLDFPATARFDTLDEAVAFANSLNAGRNQ